MQLQLLLQTEKKEYSDKLTGEKKSLNVYYVTINSIKIPLSTLKGDYTGRQVLDNYFKDNGK